MNGRLLFVVLLLVGTASLSGQQSKVLTNIQNKYSDILDQNRCQENVFFEKRDRLFKSCELTDVIDYMLKGVRDQMKMNRKKEEFSCSDVDCVEKEIIVLYKKVAHQEIKREFLDLEIEFTDCLIEMYLVESYDKSIAPFHDDSFQKKFSREVEIIESDITQRHYEAVSENLDLFLQNKTFQHPSKVELIRKLQSNVFDLLCQILDITDPKNYINKIEEAACKGIDAIEKEKELEERATKIKAPNYSIGAPFGREYKFSEPKETFPDGLSDLSVEGGSDFLDDFGGFIDVEFSRLGLKDEWCDSTEEESDYSEWYGESEESEKSGSDAEWFDALSDADDQTEFTEQKESILSEEQVNEEIERLEQGISSGESDCEGERIQDALTQFLIDPVDDSEIEEELNILEQEQIKLNKKKPVRKARKRDAFSEKRERLRRRNEIKQAKLLRKKINNIIHIAGSLFRVNGKRMGSVKEIQRKLKNPNLSFSALKALLKDAINCQ